LESVGSYAEFDGLSLPSASDRELSLELGTTAETAPMTTRAAFLAVDFPALATRLTSPLRRFREDFLLGRAALLVERRAATDFLAPLAEALLARLAAALVAPRPAACFLLAFRAADFLFDLAISICSFDPPTIQGPPGKRSRSTDQAYDGNCND
jgi:hypothetical protein